MFDIITIGTSARLSLPDTISNRNIGMQKGNGLSVHVPLMKKLTPCLVKITSKLGDILTYAKVNGIDPTVDFVLLELEKNREYDLRPNRVDMFDALERYIVEKAPSVSADQIKDYRTLRKHLTAFKEYSSQPVTFRNLNLTFYNEFMDYLFHKVVKPNGTVGLLTNSAGKNHTFVERLC